MPETPKLSIRLSQAQRAVLMRLSRKLHLDETNVIRLAITRLAESEGVLENDKRRRTMAL